MKAVTDDKIGEGENFKHAFLQFYRSGGMEEIVNPIYCKAGKHLVYKQAQKKSIRESKTLYSMTTERQLYLLPSGFYLFYVVIFCVCKFFDFAWVIKAEASEAKIWLAVNRAILNVSTESVKVQFCSHTSSLPTGWEQLESDYLMAQKGMNNLGLKINHHKPVFLY